MILVLEIYLFNFEKIKIIVFNSLHEVAKLESELS